MKSKYDFVVIGAGPAGRRAAIQSSKAGKSVLIVDAGHKIGGVCVHTGTVPSKTLRETVLNLSGWRERRFYGRSYKVKSDITAQDLKTRLHLTVKQEVEVLENQFARNNVTMVKGFATFASANEIYIKGDHNAFHRVEFDKILLSVGTKPFRPDYIPFDGQTVLDSDEILDIESLPRSLLVIGAGVIGVEYATIFSALDIPVTLVEPRSTILDFLDTEIVNEVLSDLRRRGVRIHLGTKVKTVNTDGQSTVVELEDGRVLRSELILFAAGRVGATDKLGLDVCDIEVDHRGRIAVNRTSYQTSRPNIYAAGDVIGFPSLASTSMQQGRIAACHAFDIPIATPPDFCPYGIYSVPEISTIGLTENDLREKNIPYQCGIARFNETSRGQIMGVDQGMMKLIFSLQTQHLLGVHIVGEGATELIHIGQAVLNLNGKLDYFINNIFNYPTLAEAYKVAALDAWNKMQSSSRGRQLKPAVSFDDIPANPLNQLKSA